MNIEECLNINQNALFINYKHSRQIPTTPLFVVRIKFRNQLPACLKRKLSEKFYFATKI